jgi:hypothetical protein
MLHGSESDAAPDDNFQTPDAISQYAQPSSSTEPSSRSTGAAITASGVDVQIAAERGRFDDDEPNEDESQPEVGAAAPSSTTTSHRESPVADNQDLAAETVTSARMEPSPERARTARRDTRGGNENRSRTPHRTTTSQRTPTTRTAGSIELGVRGKEVTRDR